MADKTQNLSIEVPVTITPDDKPVNDEEENQAVVIDNGSATIKAGFAGDDAPSHVFPPIIARPTNNVDTSNVYIGDETIHNNHKLTLSNPIHCGIIINWDNMEQIWHHIFHQKLKIQPEEYSVFSTEPPLNPKANREKATQIMFEKFNIPAYYTGIQQVLSLYASGRTTGIVLGAGYNTCHIVPIYEGYAEPHAILRQNIGGKDITQYLKKLLLKNNKNYCNLDIKFDDFRKMKEQYAYIAKGGLENELSKPMCKNPTCIISGFLRRIHCNTCNYSVEIDSICNTYFGDSNKFIRCKKKYKLPDGNIIELRDEVFNCAEIFFNPVLIGKHEMKGIGQLLYNSIMKLSVSIRRDMYHNVILSGGSSLLCGLSQRVKNKVQNLAPYELTVKMVAPPERRYSAWIGGSILSSLSTFQTMWISKQEYDESGPGIVHRKCF